MSTLDSERDQMRQYWEEHSKEATIEEMMLDSNAEQLTKAELPEILELLPAFAGKRVLELGAGIGRFTGILAESAAAVTAVDFMQSFIQENEAVNGAKHKNITFMCADVTLLDFPEGSFDFVFSNWLMMYLSDSEVDALAERSLKWLSPQGHVFFRESCRKQSGNAKRTANPSKYREPEQYTTAFENVFASQADDRVYRFDLVQTRPIQAYIVLKNNPNQISWQWIKVEASRTDERFQTFLDTSQFTIEGIHRYEAIFGEGFTSVGGLETTKEFVSLLQLKQNDYVLDVGCGTGGGAFYIAKNYECKVRASDLSSNMITIARERLTRSGVSQEQVVFTIANIINQEYPDSTFDVIYSRDVFMHVQDIAPTLSRFFKWLKPGGKLLFTDYCCGDQELSEEFKQYVAQRRYFLIPIQEYDTLLKTAGFADVRVEDRTGQFLQLLQQELSRTQASEEQFIHKFGKDNYSYMVNGWKAKLQRSQKGDQKWGLFQAIKPI